VPPDADEEVHGDEHHLPEKVEKEQVHGQEDAADAGQHPEQVKIKKAGAGLDLRPGSQDGHHAQEKGEQQQQQA
jgi:hypothetical protein